MRFLAVDAVLRAHPDYELVLVDRLDPEAQSALRASDDGDDLYGALVPRDGVAVDVRAVSTDTALLFVALGTAGTLPRFAREQLGDDAERTLRRLVVDGVLEALVDGTFVSGLRVAEMLASGAPSGGESLSEAALRYGQALDGLGQASLAQRLYCYGRKPVSPALRRRFATTSGVAATLGLAAGQPVRRALDDRWPAAPVDGDGRTHWWQWADAAPEPTFKLYVSPAPESVGAALTAIADTLPNRRAIGMKVAAGVPGLCRPDKIVVYFAHLEDLRASAAVLEPALAGCAAHGVAFTAAITADGLLSWGADPPAAAESTSWRRWVVEQLAAQLIAARSARLTAREPWEVALERLRLSGIDTDTWVPTGWSWAETLTET